MSARRACENEGLLLDEREESVRKILFAIRDDPAHALIKIRSGEMGLPPKDKRSLKTRRELDGAMSEIILRKFPTPNLQVALRAVLAAGANPNSRHVAIPVLFMAARDGEKEFVEILIEAKADIECGLSQGNTPVCAAARFNKPQCLAPLLAAGGKTEIFKEPHESPLAMASRCGFAEVVKLLLQHGADHNSGCAWCEPAMGAAKKGHVECLRLLAARGANLSEPRPDGSTPTILAKNNRSCEAFILALDEMDLLNLAALPASSKQASKTL